MLSNPGTKRPARARFDQIVGIVGAILAALFILGLFDHLFWRQTVETLSTQLAIKDSIQDFRSGKLRYFELSTVVSIEPMGKRREDIELWAFPDSTGEGILILFNRSEQLSARTYVDSYNASMSRLIADVREDDEDG